MELFKKVAGPIAFLLIAVIITIKNIIGIPKYISVILSLGIILVVLCSFILDKKTA